MRNHAAINLTSRREWAIALALIGCGVAVRLWVASRSVVEHFDEGVYASNLYFGEPEFAYPMQHLYAPPLLPSLIEAGMIAGLPPNLAAILPSLLAGCATLLAVWRISRRWFGAAAGVASLTLACLSDFHIAYSSTALTDVLLTLFVLLAVGATARALAWAVGDVRLEPAISESNASVKPMGKPVGRKRSERRSARPAAANQGRAAVSMPGSLVDKWGVIAGLLTAAAWWTKYNGWLPLAIALAGTGLLLALSPSARRHWQRMAFVLLLIGATAAIAWSPVPLGLEDVGGYSAVAANHAGYVVGPAGWLGAASRQIANQSAMEGLLSWLSLSVALIAVWWMTREKPEVDGAAAASMGLGRMIGWAAILSVAAVVESSFLVLLVLSVAGLVQQLLSWVQSREGRGTDESSIGLCLVLAWFLGLIVATPNYWPYPRLVLPLLACLWLAAGSGLAALVAGKSAESISAGARGWASWRLSWGVVAGLLMAAPLAYTGRAPLDGVSGSLSLDRTGMLEAARGVADRITDDLSQAQGGPLCFIFVQAEPAMVFQLRAAGFPFVQPTIVPPAGPMMFEGKAIPTYFVYGPHADRDKQFAASWREAERGFLAMSPAGIPSRPSRIVLLDSNDPRDPMTERGRIWLFRSKEDRPAETSPAADDSARKNGFDTSAAARYSSALPPEKRTSVAHGGLPVPRPTSPCPADASHGAADADRDQPSVLLIDSSAEEREVLRFALQRRGLRIFEADEAEAGLRLAQQHQPRVIVLDLESGAADREDVRAQFDAASAEHQSSLVILGRARRYDALPRDQVLAKPYHFAPLIQTIEQLAAKAA